MFEKSFDLPSNHNKQDKEKHSIETDPYASDAESIAALRSGVEFRQRRISAPDMLTSDEAARLAGVSRVTVNAWIKQGRCIGVSNLRRGFKIPGWQFAPPVFEIIPALSKNLGTSDGWILLSFLESAHEALNYKSPLTAILQGESGSRIVELSMVEGH